MSVDCEVEFSLRHELSVSYLAGEFGKLGELRRRLGEHKNGCQACNGGLGLHRQLWGERVMVWAGSEERS